MPSKSELYVLFPIKYPKIYNLYNKAKACIWFAEDIDISVDKKDWDNKLTINEKSFIKHVLAFFAASDGIVIENLGARFIGDIQNSEGRNFYGFQMGMEAIHSELYSKLIDTYITDVSEKDEMFSAIETMDVIRKKAEWAINWTESETATFAQRMVGFAIVEGIFFSGAFCSIYWLKTRGLMPGLCLSNDFISRDEGLHMEHACEQYNILDDADKLNNEVIYEMVKDAISIEDNFINEALEFRLPGMNAVLMRQYVRFVADTLLSMLKMPKLFNVENPFEFMEMLSLGGKSNFFEGRNSEYQRSGIIENKHQGNESDTISGETDSDIDDDLIYEFAAEMGLTDKLSSWLKNRKNKNNNSGIHSNKLELSDDF